MYTNVFITRQWNAFQLIIILAMMVAVVAFIVLVERGERRIPVQYAKRVVGRRMMGGQSTHLPLKVNAGGVIPVIFASPRCSPSRRRCMQVAFVRNSPYLSGMLGAIGGSSPLYYVLFTVADHLLLLLLRFDHLQSERSGGQHAQVRRLHPGHPAGQEYRRVHEQDPDQDHGGRRLYLAILSLIPQIMISGIKLQRLPLVGNLIDRISRAGCWMAWA